MLNQQQANEAPLESFETAYSKIRGELKSQAAGPFKGRGSRRV
jgi:hypothetical protein